MAWMDPGCLRCPTIKVRTYPGFARVLVQCLHWGSDDGFLLGRTSVSTRTRTSTSTSTYEYESKKEELEGAKCGRIPINTPYSVLLFVLRTCRTSTVLVPVES